jgi:hypothetical protein
MTILTRGELPAHTQHAYAHAGTAAIHLRDDMEGREGSLHA